MMETNQFILVLICKSVNQSVHMSCFVMCSGDVSGTCLNPARAFGPAVMANYWTYHWVYWVGPVGGALVAVVLLRCDRTQSSLDADTE